MYMRIFSDMSAIGVSRGDIMVCHKVRPTLRCLERRAVPAVFTVTNLADAGAGSLRQAILDANTLIGADSIVFQSGLLGAIVVSSQMTVSDPLTITGVGQGEIGLNGNNSSRLFVSNANLTLSNLGMYNARATSAPSIGFGAIVLSTAPLTITECPISGAVVSTAGGAIHQTGSSLNVTKCSFGGNFATQGASIWASGTVNLQYCIFDSNRTNNANSGGGAVWLNSGILTIDSCAFRGNGSNNFALGKGGAVYANGTFFAQNSKFMDNGAHDGGGLYLANGGTLWSCTVGSNLAQGGGSGGGIHGTGVILESTIVSTNNGGSGPDIFGSVSAKNSAIGSPSGFTLTDQGNNLAFGLDLKLSSGVEAGNAYLHYTSPCKNAGSNPGGASWDVRRAGYPRVAGPAADIGAFEIQAPPPPIVKINDGTAQRSNVHRISITLPDTALFNNVPLFTLKRASDNSMVMLTVAGTNYIPNSGMAEYACFFSSTVPNFSLNDGVYIMTVNSANITDASGQNFDGNGDGIGGDDYVSPTTPGDPNRIFRLFGDVDGDADVDTTDFIQFRLSFGGTNFALDFDGDGAVAASDFIQFRVRFGSMI